MYEEPTNQIDLEEAIRAGRIRSRAERIFERWTATRSTDINVAFTTTHEELALRSFAAARAFDNIAFKIEKERTQKESIHGPE